MTLCVVVFIIQMLSVLLLLFQKLLPKLYHYSVGASSDLALLLNYLCLHLKDRDKSKSVVTTDGKQKREQFKFVNTRIIKFVSSPPPLRTLTDICCRGESWGVSKKILISFRFPPPALSQKCVAQVKVRGGGN